MGGKAGRTPTQDKKWRHHYVWQHYLKGWVGPDGKLCYEEGGKYARESTKTIAYTRDFYRLKDIPEDQMRLVEGLIERMGEPYRTLARGWLPMYRVVFKLERLYKASGKKDSALERELDVAMSNLEENLHGHFEQIAVNPLAALRSQDAKPLQDEGFAEFSVFLALQYLRTPRMVSAISNAMQAEGIDMTAASGLLRTMFATNIGGNLFQRRRTFRIQFLQSDTTSEFITGDQPIINLTSQNELDLYYPLGPKLALRITPNSDTPGVFKITLSDDEIRAYNALISEASEAQLYATSEAVLRALRA